MATKKEMFKRHLTRAAKHLGDAYACPIVRDSAVNNHIGYLGVLIELDIKPRKASQVWLSHAVDIAKQLHLDLMSDDMTKPRRGIDQAADVKIAAALYELSCIL